jgi:hypothetical protein
MALQTAGTAQTSEIVQVSKSKVDVRKA